MFSFIKSLLDKLLLEVVKSNFWSDELRIHLVKWLLACGANHNVQDSDGYRSIYYAIVQSNTEIAKLLIDRGALDDDYRVICDILLIEL